MIRRRLVRIVGMVGSVGGAVARSGNGILRRWGPGRNRSGLTPFDASDWVNMVGVGTAEPNSNGAT